MDCGNDADQEIEADPVADLQPGRERLGTDPCNTRLAIGLIGKRVVHVVGQLAMDTDWLHSLQHALSRSLHHALKTHSQCDAE